MRKVYISNIQKFCVYDGPGIRTVIFFMGCPLRCKWCQNPENFCGCPTIMFDETKCVRCYECVGSCPNRAINITSRGSAEPDRSRCKTCGLCTEACRAEARAVCGEERSVEDILAEVMKDEVFYKNTGGGITLSGGECTLFPEYTAELLKRSKEKGIHTAIETCGFCRQDVLEMIGKYVDLFLYDLKLVTAALHKKWTGQENEIIKSNLEFLVRKGQNVVIRIPLITGVNDNEEFHHILEYLKSLSGIQHVHILPFHQMGASKYKLSGQEYMMENWAECSLEKVEECRLLAEEAGFKVNVGGWNL